MAVTLPDAKSRIIVALDTQRIEEVTAIVTELAPHVGLFKAGLDGLICSPQELEYLWAYGSPAVQRLIKVVPGIRMSDGQVDDQNRVGTPYQAIVDGADYLVIGRPILQSPDRVAAAKAFAREIESALKYLDG